MVGAEMRQATLDPANHVRQFRVELRRAIVRGEESVARVLLECPAEVSRWPIAELLLCQPRWGTARTCAFLERLYIGELRPIGMLTERQRKLIASMLGGVR